MADRYRPPRYRLAMLLVLLACAPKDNDTAAAPEPIVAVTFNTGTTEGMGVDGDGDGYTSDHAARSDEYYGDGLAWIPAVEATRDFFAALDPDVVVFQEIFWSGECPKIPEEAWPDFVCQGWTEGDPTVAQVVLGEDFQVACHPGKPDKCAAVHRRLGRFRGCEGDLCLEGMEGAGVDGCGSGARVARAVIDTEDGDSLTLVSVHGSSGLSGDDIDCRVAQVEQVFVDLGDGLPAASGARNLVMGDLNTDPGRMADYDDSAARWNDFVGGDAPFWYVTEVGPDAPGSYGGLTDIDHVISDTWDGDCRHAGLGDEPPVIEASYFDHKPVICELIPR